MCTYCISPLAIAISACVSLLCCLPHCQGVPVHKSYVLLFKYYGGGEVDYFEVASSLQVQGSVAEPTSAGGLLVGTYILVIYEYTSKLVSGKEPTIVIARKKLML